MRRPETEPEGPDLSDAFSLMTWSRDYLNDARWWRTCGRGPAEQCARFARWCYVMALELARAARRASSPPPRSPVRAGRPVVNLTVDKITIPSDLSRSASRDSEMSPTAGPLTPAARRELQEIDAAWSRHADRRRRARRPNADA